MKKSLIVAAVAAACTMLAAPQADALKIVCDGACGADVPGGEAGGTSGSGSGTAGGSGAGGTWSGGFGTSPYGTAVYIPLTMTYEWVGDQGGFWAPCIDGTCYAPVQTMTGQARVTWQLVANGGLLTWNSVDRWGISFPTDDGLKPPYNNKKEKCLATCNSTYTMDQAICDYDSAAALIGGGAGVIIGDAVLIRFGGAGGTQVAVNITGPALGTVAASAAAVNVACKGLAARAYISCTQGTCGS